MSSGQMSIRLTMDLVEKQVARELQDLLNGYKGHKLTSAHVQWIKTEVEVVLKKFFGENVVYSIEQDPEFRDKLILVTERKSVVVKLKIPMT